jgi:hypothetical protein
MDLAWSRQPGFSGSTINLFNFKRNVPFVFQFAIGPSF